MQANKGRDKDRGRDGQAAMLLTANELQEAQARSTLKDLRPYDQFSGDPMGVLAGMLS